MAGVGRNLHLVPNPMPKYPLVKGHLPLDQAAQRPIQPSLEHLQGWGTHSSSGQTTPGPFTPSCAPPVTLHPISLWTLHPTHQSAWPDIYWCWHTAMCTCTCFSCWYQNHSSKISRCFWWHYTLFCLGLLQSSTYTNLCRGNPRKAIHWCIHSSWQWEN